DIASSLRRHGNYALSKNLVLRDKLENIKATSRARRVRMMLEELGTTFIKLGQILSVRPDLVPGELIEELEFLQDLTPTFESDLAIEVIEDALGKPLKELFERFEEKPLASAAIAQVHRATLQGGREVIIKVQRPAIRERIEVDMDIRRTLAKYAQKYNEELKHYNTKAIVAALEHTLELELDYYQEVNNINRFRSNRNQGEGGIIVPEV